jgi:ABC-2 type transport system permease protein
MSTPTVVTPIADLSYRNYDGPLEPPTFRWWVIAKRLILSAIKLRSLWVVTVLSGWYYMVMIVILFFMQQLAGTSPQAQITLKTFLGRIVWKDQFLHGFSFSQHLLLVIALMVGAGAIANDNRANALLVYLSKPCTKLDYVFGKWVGLFLVILGVISVPTLAFYGYGLLSFRDQGFLKDDPYLLLRVLCVLPLSAALHTSIVLAISSMFRQGRIAGATYAGIYFLSYFFTVLMEGIWAVSNGQANGIIKNLYYCSIDGVQIGLARAILHPFGTHPFGVPPGKDPAWIAAPPLVPFLLFVVVIIVASLSFVWSRVRAVEVV